VVEIATIKLLRRLQEEGYTMLVSGRMNGHGNNFYFPEKTELDLDDFVYSLPLEEDQALSIGDALRWLTDEELKELCVITSA